jgi:deazaflavin-dependent oxidoreductase (nitroreductase family)
VAPRYLPPGFLFRRILNPFVTWTDVTTTLAVAGRKTGKTHTVPVNVLAVDNGRYLVAPRGETQWARNLRASGQGELRRRGKRASITATEITDPDKQARIVGAYIERFGYQVRWQFRRLPDPADHPVFQIFRKPDRT